MITEAASLSSSPNDTLKIHASITEVASLLNVDNEYATYAAIMSRKGAAATSRSMTLTFNLVNHEASDLSDCASAIRIMLKPGSRLLTAAIAR
jgi:hypothetical protein